jgi:hypothetical protein
VITRLDGTLGIDCCGGLGQTVALPRKIGMPWKTWTCVFHKAREMQCVQVEIGDQRPQNAKNTGLPRVTACKQRIKPSFGIEAAALQHIQNRRQTSKIQRFKILKRSKRRGENLNTVSFLLVKKLMTTVNMII